MQGQGIQNQYSTVIRIAAFMTVPIMLTINGIYGRTTGVISAKYNLLATPPGPFFAIWGVIYLSLIVSAFYMVLNNVWSANVIALFAIASLLNGLWTFVFSYSSIISNNICSVILISMAILNEALWIEMELKNNNFSQSIQTWNLVNRNIISFYQGWLVAASNLNFGIILVYTFGISKKTQTKIFWVLGPMCILSMIILNLTFQKGFINNIAMYISAIYALIGAFISTKRRYDLSQQQIQKQLQAKLKSYSQLKQK